MPRYVGLLDSSNLLWRTDEKKENPRHLHAVAPGQGRNIGVTVLAPARRTQPKAISLVASSRGNMVSTVAAHKQELGVFTVPCLGASVA